MAFLNFDDEMSYVPAGTRRRRGFADFIRDTIGDAFDTVEEIAEDFIPPPPVPPLEPYQYEEPQYEPPPEEYPAYEESPAPIFSVYEEEPQSQYPTYGLPDPFNPFNANPMDMDPNASLEFVPDAQLDPSQIDDQRGYGRGHLPDFGMPAWAGANDDGPPPSPPEDQYPMLPPQSDEDSGIRNRRNSEWSAQPIQIPEWQGPLQVPEGPVDYSNTEPGAWTTLPVSPGAASEIKFDINRALQGKSWADVPFDIQAEVGQSYARDLPQFESVAQARADFQPIARQALNQPTSEYEEARLKYGEAFDYELAHLPENPYSLGIDGQRYLRTTDPVAKQALERKLFLDYIGNAENGLDFGQLGPASLAAASKPLAAFDKYVNQPAQAALATVVAPAASAGILAADELGFGDVTPEERARALRSLDLRNPVESAKASNEMVNQSAEFYHEQDGITGLVGSAVFDTARNPLSYIPVGASAKLTERLATLGIEQAAVRVPVALATNVLDSGGLKFVLGMNLTNEALQRDYIPFLDANDPATALIIPLLGGVLAGPASDAALNSTMAGYRIGKDILENPQNALVPVAEALDKALAKVQDVYHDPASIERAMSSAADAIANKGEGLATAVARSINDGILSGKLISEIARGAPDEAFAALRVGVEDGRIAVSRGIQIFKDAIGGGGDESLPRVMDQAERTDLRPSSARDLMPEFGGALPDLAIPSATAAGGAALGYALGDKDDPLGGMITGAAAGSVLGLAFLGIAGHASSTRAVREAAAKQAIDNGSSPAIVGAPLTRAARLKLQNDAALAAENNIMRLDMSENDKLALKRAVRAEGGNWIQTMYGVLNPVSKMNSEARAQVMDALGDMKVKRVFTANGGNMDAVATTSDNIGLNILKKIVTEAQAKDPDLQWKFALAFEDPSMLEALDISPEHQGVIMALRNIQDQWAQFAVQHSVLMQETVDKSAAYYSRGLWDLNGDGSPRIHGSRFSTDQPGFTKEKTYETKMEALRGAAFKRNPDGSLTQAGPWLSKDYNIASAVEFHVNEIDKAITNKRLHDIIRNLSEAEVAKGQPGLILTRRQFGVLPAGDRARYVNSTNSFLHGDFSDMETRSLVTQASRDIHKAEVELRRVKRSIGDYGADERKAGAQLDAIEERITKANDLISDATTTGEARLAAQLSILADAREYMTQTRNLYGYGMRREGKAAGVVRTLRRPDLDAFLAELNVVDAKIAPMQAKLVDEQVAVRKLSGANSLDEYGRLQVTSELIAYNTAVAQAVTTSKEIQDTVMRAYTGPAFQRAKRQAQAEVDLALLKPETAELSTTSKRTATNAVREATRAGRAMANERVAQLEGRVDEMLREYRAVTGKGERAAAKLRGPLKPSRAAHAPVPLETRQAALLTLLEGEIDPATVMTRSENGVVLRTEGGTRSGGLRDQVRGLRDELGDSQFITYVRKDIEPIFNAWGEGGNNIADTSAYALYNKVNQEARRSALGGAIDLYMLGATGKTALLMALPVIGNASPGKGLQILGHGMKAAFNKEYRIALLMDKSEALENLVKHGMGFGEDHMALYDSALAGADSRSLMGAMLDAPGDVVAKAAGKISARDVENKLQFGALYDKANLAMEDIQFSGWSNTVKVLWGEEFANQSIKKGMDPDAAWSRAAKAMDDLFGGKEFKLAGWSPDTQALMRIGLLAPNWMATRLSLFRDVLNAHEIDSYGRRWAVQTAFGNIAAVTVGTVAVNALVNDGEVDWSQVKDSLSQSMNPMDPHFLEFRAANGQWYAPANWEKDIVRAPLAATYLVKQVIGQGSEDNTARLQETVAGYGRARLGIGARILWDISQQLLTETGALDFTGQPVVQGRIHTSLGGLVDKTSEFVAMEMAQLLPQFLTDALRFIPATGGETVGEKLSLGKSSLGAYPFNITGIGRSRNITPLQEALAEANKTRVGDSWLVDPSKDSWDDLDSVDKKKIEEARNEDGTLRWPEVATYRERYRPEGYTSGREEVESVITTTEDRFLDPASGLTAGDLRKVWSNQGLILSGVGKGAYGTGGDFSYANKGKAGQLISSWSELYEQAKTDGVIDYDKLGGLQGTWMAEHNADWMKANGLDKTIPGAVTGRQFVETYFHMDDSPLRNDYYNAISGMSVPQGGVFTIPYFDMAQHTPLNSKGDTALTTAELQNWTRASKLRSGRTYGEVEDIYNKMVSEAGTKKARDYQEKYELSKNEYITRLAKEDGFDAALLRELDMFMHSPNNPLRDAYKKKYPNQVKWLDPDLTWDGLNSWGAVPLSSSQRGK